MSKSAANVKSLFQTAQTEGTLSPASVKALIVPNLGAQIQAGLGISVGDVDSSEVTLVTLLIDDSGSIRFASNAQAVRDGHNIVRSSLLATKQLDSILMHTRYLNGKILYPYSLLAQTIEMDSSNYDPNGGTPLYDQTVVTLGAVLAKFQEFADNGVHARTITLIVTDGNDENPFGSQSLASVNSVVRDMLRAESHIVAAFGVDDGGHTDFRQIFKGMGIEDEWILTPGNSPSEIRKAFRLFSQSAVRASQNANSFSKTAAGGFGNP